ncbi:GTPase [Buchnera aphidicola]|uniref:GTP-binding protein n=1 Tax=Buchnera aphidicola (Anoecia oenotherae) TaxID=1241833 RepID=A0A4D6XYK8_9GAMM|nr:GTPase [Buchnera aphidicola]QCI19574.1 GTP-binding protein [Buchnera aphidicola (Anoecia oenotherae)]
MKEIVTLVGRPNVGKSTLFNVLTNTRDALISDYPGLTRDRNYGNLDYQKKIVIIDTAGIFYCKNKNNLEKEIDRHTFIAIKEATIVLFVVDGYEGITNDDYVLAKTLRIQKKRIIVLINKMDKVKEKLEVNDFYSLGFKHMYYVSSLNKKEIKKWFIKYIIHEIYKIRKKINNITQDEKFFFPSVFFQKNRSDQSISNDNIPINIAVIGRPNVGKSTLINSIIGIDRVITSSFSGTTRDSLSVPVQHYSKRYIFIDTAGIKKKNMMI